MTAGRFAPRTRPSHMNQNRCWPGVPNRYKTSPASRATRPKSIATVVAVLPGTYARSPSPSPAAVMTPSVVSGVISDPDPTNVVFPAPKPPATTPLTDVTAASAAPARPASAPAPGRAAAVAGFSAAGQGPESRGR